MTDPREAEATTGTASFNFRGEAFTVPLEYADMPLSYLEAASDGKGLAVQARELLGPEQWAKVRAMNLTGRGLDELSDAINKAMGTDEGEEPASSD
jgi:hypothetical protein